MNDLTLDKLKQAVLDAGLEIYRVDGTTIRIAERVRVHLMDSGVSVALNEGIHIRFTVRSQRSDFPSGSAHEQFAMVRERMRDAVADRGFNEVEASTRNLTDPVDEENLLDVWHELTYSKHIDDVDALVDDVRWALGLPKCVV